MSADNDSDSAIERPLFQCIVLFLLGEFLVFAVTLTLGVGAAGPGT